MNREVLDRWCERGILGLVLAIMVFGPLALGAVRPSEFLIIQGLTIGVMALWVARLWLGEQQRLLWPPICWAVLIFTGYAVWRYYTCDIEYVGRLELIRILIYAFLFFAILNNLHRQESTQIISFTMVFLALAISGYAIYQFLTGSDHVWHFITPYKGRGCGTYICPNHLGGFLEMLLPLALAYTMVGRSGLVLKILLGYAGLVMLAGIGVTMSRGSWVAGGFAMLLLFAILAMHRSYRLPSLLLLVVLVAGGGYFVTKTDFFKDRWRQAVIAYEKPEADMRYDLWVSAVQMWRGHVWLGVGPGHFDHRFRAYRPVSVQKRPDQVHNDYLNILADWGAVGATIVGAGLVALAWGVMRTWKHVRRAENAFKSTQSNKFGFVLGATLGLLALLLHSAVDFNLHIPANAILAVCLVALLSSHLRFATEDYWVRVKSGLRVLMSGVLLAGGVYLGTQEARLGRESFWLQRAESTRSHTGLYYTPEELAAREKAFAAEPNNFNNTQEIGEAYRLESFAGNSDYAQLAEKAMTWFARGTNANPYDDYSLLRYGICLDWLERHEEADPYFNRAVELDPNGYFTAAYVGWHNVQKADYTAARSWCERSIRLQSKTNDIAVNYLQIANNKLLEAATVQSGRLLK